MHLVETETNLSDFCLVVVSLGERVVVALAGEHTHTKIMT